MNLLTRRISTEMRFGIILGLVGALFASSAEARHHRHARGGLYDSGSVVEHPAGCPHRAFCGCGAALHVFGHHVRELWLAANWLRFPRAMGWAPGVAGVRRHHVFIVEQVLGDGRVLAWDANSGRGLTRVHVISTAGYVPVQPRG
jgi:hypothetical protein